VSLHWNGARVAVVGIPAAELDLVNNEWNKVTIEVLAVEGAIAGEPTGSVVSVIIVDGTDESEHVLFDEFFIPGMVFPSGARVAFGARTGGAADNYDIDNVNVVFGESVKVGVGPFIRGDCNNDGSTAGVTDAVSLLNYNFTGGATPTCLAACDVDGNGSTAGVTDAIRILNYNFLGAEPPPAPFPNCGLSESAGDAALTCLEVRGCAAL
jgi:hypothetical protein